MLKVAYIFHNKVYDGELTVDESYDVKGLYKKDLDELDIKTITVRNDKGDYKKYPVGLFKQVK